MKSSLECVISTSLLILASGITGKITNPPQNAVVEVGGQAIFNCTSDLSGQNWIFSMTREDAENPSAQIVIVFGCLVQPGFSTHYEVQRPGGSNNICNLIVKTTTLQQAGVYSCSDAVIGQSAILIVIDRDAQIAVNRLPETVEGDTVSMSYTVSYNTSTASSKTPTIQPVLSWINFAGTTVGLTASNYTETAYSVTSSISVTAGREDIRPYTCSISYQIKWPSPPTGLSFASNTPSAVPNPPNTSTINVLYAPIISSIEMSEETPVCPGNKAVKLTCFATANPPPDYSWIGPDSISYTGKTIEVEMNGVYICNATNVIRGSTRSIAKETTLNVAFPNVTAEECTVRNPNKEPSKQDWIIITIVCVVVGGYILGNAIATVVFLIYYNRNIGFKLQLNDRFLWLRKMLSCMNENVKCICPWIFLSVCVFALIGIFFTISITVIASCSKRRRKSADSADEFHDPRDITNHNGNPKRDFQYSTPGFNGEDEYAEISLADVNVRNGKDHQKQKNGKTNGKTKSSEKKKNDSPSVHQKGARGGYVANPVPAAPSLPPLNHQNQVSQPTHGPLYSDLPLPIGDSNVQPQQFIAGNMDNYSELKLA